MQVLATYTYVVISARALISSLIDGTYLSPNIAKVTFCLVIQMLLLVGALSLSIICGHDDKPNGA